MICGNSICTHEGQAHAGRSSAFASLHAVELELAIETAQACMLLRSVVIVLQLSIQSSCTVRNVSVSI